MFLGQIAMFPGTIRGWFAGYLKDGDGNATGSHHSAAEGRCSQNRQASFEGVQFLPGRFQHRSPGPQFWSEIPVTIWL